MTDYLIESLALTFGIVPISSRGTWCQAWGFRLLLHSQAFNLSNEKRGIPFGDGARESTLVFRIITSSVENDFRPAHSKACGNRIERNERMDGWTNRRSTGKKKKKVE